MSSPLEMFAEKAREKYPDSVDLDTGEPVDDYGYGDCARQAFIEGAKFVQSLPPRQITEQSELDALPNLSVVMTGDQVWQKVDGLYWRSPSILAMKTSIRLIHSGPFMVVWEPSDG